MRTFVPIAASSIFTLMSNDALAFTSIVSSTVPRSFKLSVAQIAFASEEKVEQNVQVCMEGLEMRLREGPGALSSEEVSNIESAVMEIAEYMDARAAASPGDLIPPEGRVGADDLFRLETAAARMDASTVSSLLQKGLEMDEATTDAAFWAVVNAVDRAEALDEPLSGDVPRMIHHIFDADHRHLLTREKQTTNVTCMCPDTSAGVEGAARRMNYIFDDMSHKDLPLAEGRVCEGGDCCEACSRNIFPTFITDAESDLGTFSGFEQLTFNNLESVKSSTIIQFVRLIERVRRTIAHEYGLPLGRVLPLQAYSRKYVAGTTQKGGGGGEGDFVILHTDEATHSGYHYSAVLYMSTQGEDFEGGNFVFNDPDPNYVKVESDDDLEDDVFDGNYASLEEKIRKVGRILTPFCPTRGAAVIFSSGWENMHEVEKITSGTRYAVPCFFTTCPVPEAAYDQMHVGKPKTDEDIADDWLHLLLAHRQESPMESVGRVKELLMKWHYICTPLSQH